MREFSILTLAAALFFFVAPARAQSPTEGKPNPALTRGVEAMKAHRYQDARAIFLDIWKEKPAYDVALILGQVEVALKQYRDAAEHLSFGLRNLPSLRNENALRTRSEKFLEQAKAQVGWCLVQVNRAGAEILVDDRPVGTSPLPAEIFLDPGPHAISARMQGFKGEPVSVLVQANQQHTVELKLEAVEQSKPAYVEKTPQPAASQPRDTGSHTVKHRSWILWAGLPATALLTTLSVIYRGAGNRADDAVTGLRDEFTREGTNCSQVTSPECDRYARRLDDRESADQKALFTGIGAGVVFTATLGTYLLWPKKTRSVSMDVGPGSLHVRGVF